MKNSFAKILFVIFTAIGLLGFSGQAKAVVDPVVVEFEKTPHLFSEANFVPGSSVSRWIKAVNNAGEILKVAIRTANQSDPSHMGDFMGLKIRVGGAVLHNITMTQFLSSNSYNLSDLGVGGNAQYDLEVSFDSSAGSALQGKSIGFDIVLDFTGSSGIYSVIDNGGGGGGGMGYYLTPTPTLTLSPTPTVAGTTTTGGEQGTGGGLAQGGGIIGGASTGTGNETGGSETPSPSPTGLAAGANILSAFGGIFSLWWVWPILIIIALLILVRILLGRKNKTE